MNEPAEPSNRTPPADLERAVRERYARVAADPTGEFAYPVGREGAEGLGYDTAWLTEAPAESVRLFVGVGHPMGATTPRPGWRILDVGCGAGLDVFLAATLAGRTGLSVGIDTTPEMVEAAERAHAGFTAGRVAFALGRAEQLPFGDAAFDAVVSNGALNLVRDKPTAFREIRRVLRPGGRLAVADLLVRETIPPEVLENVDAWSS